MPPKFPPRFHQDGSSLKLLRKQTFQGFVVPDKQFPARTYFGNVQHFSDFLWFQNCFCFYDFPNSLCEWGKLCCAECRTSRVS